MIGRKVRIKTKSFEGNVQILDKRLTNMAEFYKSAIMNNSSFEVYIGMFEDLEKIDSECPIIEFKPNDIIKFL